MVLGDECFYEVKTISKNGVVVEEIETKVCKETIKLNKQNFFITWLTDEKYQNSVVMVFMGILENLEKGGKSFEIFFNFYFCLVGRV